MQRPIRGFEFNIDTGKVKPICVKPPRYGPHEQRVITLLVEQLQEKGIVEDDDGPWGSQIVLASKPSQGHVHWSQFVFRLCVSYRKLNEVTRPFAFPVMRCDDAAEKAGDAAYFITMDLDAGYWQVNMRKSARAKTAFYTPRGKKRFRSMPMGAKNAHPAFVAMVTTFEDKWDRLYKQRELKQLKAKTKGTPEHKKKSKEQRKGKDQELNTVDDWQKNYKAKTRQTNTSEPGSAVIVDDIILFATTAAILLTYFRCVIEVLKHYRVTVKLRKTRFFPKRAEFVGVDIMTEGNSPAESKYEAIEKLTKPKLFSDIRMLTGLLGFYRAWIALFEVRIKPWREHSKKAPTPGSAEKSEEAKILAELWSDSDDKLLQQLKRDILDGPVMKRPDPNRRFYLKTDWSAEAQGAVLLQAGCSTEEEDAMMREVKGGKCEFDKTVNGLRLRPIAFISMRRKLTSSRHSFVGEAATGRWAMLKFKHHLIGREFTWITDCSGLLNFFETDYEATHTMQRWKLELLRFDFTIVHRPAKMLTECDMLSRYNTWTDEWRNKTAHTEDTAAKTLFSLYTQDEQDTGSTTYGRWCDEQKQTKGPIALDFERDLGDILHTLEEETPVPVSHLNPKVIGSCFQTKTAMAEICDKSRALWIIDSGAQTITTAMTSLGIQPLILRASDEVSFWQEQTDSCSLTTLRQRIERDKTTNDTTPEWIIIPRAQDYQSDERRAQLEEIITTGKEQGAKAAIILWTTTDPKTERHHARELQTLAAELGWDTKTGTLRNEEQGGHIEGRSTYLIAAPTEVITALGTEEFGTLESTGTIQDILDDDNNIFTDYFRWHEQTDEELKPSNTRQDKAAVRTKLNIIDSQGKTKTVPIFDTDRPGPNILTREHEIGGKVFCIEARDGIVSQAARPLRNHELLRAIGYEDKDVRELTKISTPWDPIIQRLRDTVPRQSLEHICAALFHTEQSEAERKMIHDLEAASGEDQEQERNTEAYGNPERARTLLTRVINRWTTLPAPTEQSWRAATAQDPDLSKVLKALTEETELIRAGLSNKTYHTEWKKGKLEQEEGIIYQLEEPKATRIRQLRRKVVPPTLRRTILAAYHATPLAGHTGFYKTYWRIAVRFWWPGMSTDVKEAVLKCGHCRVANATSHEAQQILGALTVDEPFDVITIDVWYPGKTDNKPPPTRGREDRFQKAILTCLCTMTGFASLAFLSAVNSEATARMSFSHFFIPNGLPKLVLIDDGSEFKGVMVQMCETLGIQYYVAAPEEHNAIFSERFHRYLNKVERLGVVDHQSYEKWKMNAIFASYAWNASPIDGTDVIRSFAAKARTFRFPLDIQGTHEEARIPQEGEQALQHLETMFPLWFQQKELLRVINEERRARHRELANKNKKKRTFQPGDLVLVRKQVNSKGDEGKPAKLTLRAKGPYRILKPAGENSYYVQKIPAIQNVNKRPGKRHKELAMRMEKLPSSLVVHKRVDTTDTRFAQMEGQLAANPLEKNLGFFDFGKYTKAPDDADFAFVKINEMWNEPIEAGLNSEPEDDSDTEEETNDEGSDSSGDDNDPNTKTKTTKRKQDTDPNPRPGKRNNPNTQEPSTTTTTTTPEEGPTNGNKHNRHEDHHDHNAKRQKKTVQLIDTETTGQQLQKLWKNIRNSKDKLFFIRRLEPGKTIADWHLVQVDLDETNPKQAKKIGQYHVRYYIRHYQQAKTKPIRECKQWPLIREMKGEEFGAIIMVRPEKVDEVLAKRPNTRNWYQEGMNLAEDSLVGPFDFTKINGDRHRVAFEHWNKLTTLSKDYEVDARDVTAITPLPSH
jgi:hypothetical protein